MLRTLLIAITIVSLAGESSLAQTGGIGRGGFGRGGTSTPKPAVELKPVEWKSSAPLPSWLKAAQAASERVSKHQEALHKLVTVGYQGVQLGRVLEDLSGQVEAPFHIVVGELDLIGLDPDLPITCNEAQASLGAVLVMILDPFELTYTVGEIGIQITSKDAADADPELRYYDLAWIFSTSDGADELLNTIQMTIDPDSWMTNGGTSTLSKVQSILVVSAPHTTQQKIQDMFGNLIRLKRSTKLVDQDSDESETAFRSIDSGKTGSAVLPQE